MVRMGSLFAGVGGFELGASMAFDEAGVPHKTLWQVEKDLFCQKVLKKHWPQAKIYNDVRDITKDNVAPVDVVMAGFPCQDLSLSGAQKGIYEGKKSSLWWEVWRITRDLRPRILVLENVANIVRLGGADVIGSLAAIGYDAEWSIVSARERGACHLRERWFCVAYPNRSDEAERRAQRKGHKISARGKGDVHEAYKRRQRENLYNSGCFGLSKQFITIANNKERNNISKERPYWQRHPHPSAFCRVDDGVPDRSHRLKALGNAIVPQCSQYVFECIIKSGLLS